MKLCLIIGDPIAHSLSPAIHNAAYHELAIDNQYRYEARRVASGELQAFMQEVRDTGIRGVSCTAPHKVAIMDYLDEIDSTAREIGAVNSVVNDDGVLKGYNTDWIGIVAPLEKLTDLRGKKIALLGAGGAARSIAYGLAKKGATLTIYNRTLDKARALAREFGATAASSEDPARLAAIKDMDIVINASSLGMRPNEAKTPLAKEYLGARQIVFDAVYSPYETRLLSEAAEQGAQVIHGTEMLLHQGIAQFKLYTGYDAPEAVMSQALKTALSAQENQP